MPGAKRWVWQVLTWLWSLFTCVLARTTRALFPLCFLLGCVFAQAGCACEPEGQVQSTPIIECRPQFEQQAVFPRLEARKKTTVPGTIAVSWGVTDHGDAALTMPLAVPPSSGVEPSLAVTYTSSGGNGVLGMGFSISGASSIVRCPKTRAIDGPEADIGVIHYDSSDAFCLDSRRLVRVGQTGDTIEYRVFPDDTHVKVVQHLATSNESFFEAFLPSGSVVKYGTNAGSLPRARNGAPRAWLASAMRSPRGSTVTYGYCFAEADGYTAEYALQELKYSGFDGEEGTRVVSFVYRTKDPDDIRSVFSGGMEFQSSLLLEEVQTRVGDELALRYQFSYDQSETTGRTRLVAAQKCGADGACTPENKFQYANTRSGFERVETTKIAAPTSKLASYLLADFNGDGLDDLLTPDTNPTLSTPDNPITEWKVARNHGNGFAASKVAYSQEWI